MRKLVFFISVFALFTTTKHYGQSLYKREWGTLLPIFDRPIKPFSPKKLMVRNHFFVAEVNVNTGYLYLVNADGDEIYEYRPNEINPKLIYKIPTGEKGGSIIENIKFDSENNLIFTGRTTNENFATPGVYSERIMIGMSAKPSFISKINLDGKLIWFTYFHDIALNEAHLTVDKNNNIYVLNKRNKNSITSPSFFQTKADTNSTNEYQDAISKLDANGKHIWSTFYTKDFSIIRSIVAGTKGLYIYGDHMNASVESNYFGTDNTHQKTIVRNRNTSGSISSVFLSKFNFDGNRLWSTYFGEQNSNVPFGSLLKNNNTLSVIGDDAYILTSFRVGSKLDKNKNTITDNAFLKKPISNSGSTTVSKFSQDGKRIWTSFLHQGEHLFANEDGLFISSANTNNINSQDNLPITVNSYQTTHGGGNTDVYTYIVSLNGTSLEYASFYGFEGTDSGVTLPSKHGYYVLGNTNMNLKPKSDFATKKSSTKEYYKNVDYYVGDFLSYFKLNKKIKKKNDQ